jgi:hypothetical protein
VPALQVYGTSLSIVAPTLSPIRQTPQLPTRFAGRGTVDSKGVPCSMWVTLEARLILALLAVSIMVWLACCRPSLILIDKQPFSFRSHNWIDQMRELTSALNSDQVSDVRAIEMLAARLPANFADWIQAVRPDVRQRVQFAVNIGANDGKDNDPIYRLLQDFAYSGLAFEGDVKPILWENLGAVNHSGAVHIIEEFAVPKSIGQRLHDLGAPQELDALKVDIDSIDYPVMQAILESGMRPAVLMMEINQNIPPPFSYYLDMVPGFEQTWAFVVNSGYGVSAQAAWELCDAHGYALVDLELSNRLYECSACEHNMWFVRKDLLKQRGGRDFSFLSAHGLARFFWARHLQAGGGSCWGGEEWGKGPQCLAESMQRAATFLCGKDDVDSNNAAYVSEVLRHPRFRAQAQAHLQVALTAVMAHCPKGEGMCKLHGSIKSQITSSVSFSGCKALQKIK